MRSLPKITDGGHPREALVVGLLLMASGIAGLLYITVWMPTPQPPGLAENNHRGPSTRR
jgi:hypothetical protein